jgi:hypothetical protein
MGIISDIPAGRKLMQNVFRAPAGDKGKATKAAKAVKKSQWKKGKKPRYSVVFHRPKTLKRTRDPKVPRQRCVFVLFLAGSSVF